MLYQCGVRVLTNVRGSVVKMIKAQFSDIVKAYEMIVTAKTAGLDFWEGVMLALFILKDVAIVGGILGTFIWYVKGKK